MSYKKTETYSCDLCGNNLEACPDDIKGHECGFDIYICFREEGSGYLNRPAPKETSYYHNPRIKSKHICERCQWECLYDMVEDNKAERLARNLQYFKSREYDEGGVVFDTQGRIPE